MEVEGEREGEKDILSLVCRRVLQGKWEGESKMMEAGGRDGQGKGSTGRDQQAGECLFL